MDLKRLKEIIIKLEINVYREEKIEIKNNTIYAIVEKVSCLVCRTMVKYGLKVFLFISFNTCILIFAGA